MFGAVLAGGKARRFGSDKALAALDGQPLIAHVIAALSLQTHRVVVCGHDWADGIALPDRPVADLGPLEGLNAALHYAFHNRFDAVLTAGCDTPFLPADLLAQLSQKPGPALIDDIPIVGYWPAQLAPILDTYLTADGNR